MKTKTALLKAADFLSENEWCKEGFAEDKDGYTINPDDGDAHAYCVLGAIWAISDNETMKRCTKRIAKANQKLLNIPKEVVDCEPEDLYDYIGDYNDRKSQTKGNLVRFLRQTAKKKLK